MPDSRWNAIKKLLDDLDVSDDEMPEFVASFTLALLVKMADDAVFSSTLKQVREHCKRPKLDDLEARRG